jgi:hypothetical protein
VKLLEPEYGVNKTKDLAGAKILAVETQRYREMMANQQLGIHDFPEDDDDFYDAVPHQVRLPLQGSACMSHDCAMCEIYAMVCCLF